MPAVPLDDAVRCCIGAYVAGLTFVLAIRAWANDDHSWPCFALMNILLLAAVTIGLRTQHARVDWPSEADVRASAEEQE